MPRCLDSSWHVNSHRHHRIMYSRTRKHSCNELANAQATLDKRLKVAYAVARDFFLNRSFSNRILRFRIVWSISLLRDRLYATSITKAKGIRDMKQEISVYARRNLQSCNRRKISLEFGYFLRLFQLLIRKIVGSRIISFVELERR